MDQNNQYRENTDPLRAPQPCDPFLAPQTFAQAYRDYIEWVLQDSLYYEDPMTIY